MSDTPTRHGISSDTLTRAGWRNIQPAEAAELVGMDTAGVLIPYRHLDGAPVSDGGKPYNRLRLAQPRAGQKYHQRAGTRQHCYLSPALAEIGRQGGDLVIVEGEAKALSLCEAGVPAVGMSGFFGFCDRDRTVESKTGAPERFVVVAELAAAVAKLKPARLLLLGDSDTALNADFSRAAARFADLFRDFPVALPRIPLNGPAKGVDDVREALGPRFAPWWDERVASAVQIEPSTRPTSLFLRLLKTEEAAVAKLAGNKRDWAKRRLVESGAHVLGEPLDFDELAGFVAETVGINRRPYKQACQARREEIAMEARAKECAETGDGPRKIRVDAQAGQWTRDALEVLGATTYLFAGNLCLAADDGRLRPLAAAEAVSYADDAERMQFGIETKDGFERTNFTESSARVLLGAVTRHLGLLRPVDVVSPVPALAWDGVTARTVETYDRSTRILARGGKVEKLTAGEATSALTALLCDFDFASPGDAARCISLLVTPALVLGGFLGNGRPDDRATFGRAPFFWLCKSSPGAGAGTLAKLTAAVYGLPAEPVARIDDPARFLESLSTKLLAGDGLIYLDNVRGAGLSKSPEFESLLTEPSFVARIPYRQGEVDVTRRVFVGCSNGAVLSKDLATRTVSVQIRKQPVTHTWRAWPEGSLLAHAVANRARYLGACYALVRAWAEAGRPAGQVTGFRFSEWERAASWIVAQVLPGIALLDATHAERSERLADPDHDFLLALCRALSDSGMRGEFAATELAEIAIKAELRTGEPADHASEIGRALARRFATDGEHAFAGDFIITRSHSQKDNGRELKKWSVRRAGTPAPAAQPSDRTESLFAA